MKPLKLLSLATIFLVVQTSITFAQSSCLKTAYTKKVQIKKSDNNIVENASFEEGNYAWLFYPDSNRAKITTDPTNTSRKCVRMVTTDNAGGDALISQAIPHMTAGNTYTMSAYLRSKLTSNPNLKHVTMQVRFNYPGYSETIPVLFWPTSTWQKYSFSFTVPTRSDIEVSKAEVLFYRGQNDTVWVDSVKISDSNLVANADFETGIGNWLQVPNSSRVSRVSNGVRGFGNCIKITSLNTADGDALLSESVPNLTRGKRYTIRGYMKSKRPVPTNSATVSMQVRLNYSGGWVVYKDTLIKPDSAWRPYTYSFNVPDTSLPILNSLMQVSYYRGNNDSVWVDNLELLNKDTMYNLVNASIPHIPTGILLDSFKGTPGSPLNFDRWLVVKKNWGVNNNGVVPENLELLSGGGMRFHGHGNLYNGPVYGSTNLMGNGKIHVGACIATKDYYASGKYEVYAKLTPGMINAFWTFHYIEDANYQSGGIKNTEIDFEFPASPTDTVLNPGFSGHKSYIDDMNVNTWGGLCNGEGYCASLRYRKTPMILSQAYHKYTIEWHTGGGGISPSVKWYVDDTLARTVTDSSHVGFRAARFWLGVWYASDLWVNGNDTSIMQYTDKYMDVKWVKITPYYEPNDVYENETEPQIGYVTPQYGIGYPKYPATGAKSQPTDEDNNNSLLDGNENTENLLVGIDEAGNNAVVRLHSQTDDGIKNLKILNINGQVVYKYSIGNELVNTYTINTSSYAPGIYVLQCETNSGRIFNKKLSVIK